MSRQWSFVRQLQQLRRRARVRKDHKNRQRSALFETLERRDHPGAMLPIPLIGFLDLFEAGRIRKDPVPTDDKDEESRSRRSTFGFNRYRGTMGEPSVFARLASAADERSRPFSPERRLARGGVDRDTSVRTDHAATRPRLNEFSALYAGSLFIDPLSEEYLRGATNQVDFAGMSFDSSAPISTSGSSSGSGPGTPMSADGESAEDTFASGAAVSSARSPNVIPPSNPVANAEAIPSPPSNSDVADAHAPVDPPNTDPSDHGTQPGNEDHKSDTPFTASMLLTAQTGGAEAPTITTAETLSQRGEGRLFVAGTVPSQGDSQDGAAQIVELFAVQGDWIRRLGDATVVRTETGEGYFSLIANGKIGENDLIYAHLSQPDESTGPISEPVVLSTPIDQDADGVSEAIERLAPNGDGNRDGISDAVQREVTSIPDAAKGRMVTIDARGQSLQKVRQTLASTHAANARLPYGLFEFEITGVPVGGIAAVDIYLPDDANIEGYFKQDSLGRLMPFQLNGGTGAVRTDFGFTLYLQDGGRGDEDGLANGVIVDPGGPGQSGIVTIGCSGLDPLAGWTISESGGRNDDEGTVVAEGNSLVMREGNSFVVELSRQITIPNDPSILTFDYQGTFDLTDTDFINDAFEVALLDSTHDTIVPSFQFQRDSYFNLTEGELPASGADTTHFPIQTGIQVSGAVDLDISQLAPGTTAELLFRLVNDDSDMNTTFGIVCRHAPEAENDTYVSNEDTQLIVPAQGVLANDTDEDGDALTVSSHTQPAHGSVVVNADGSFTFSPHQHFNGTDTFTYVATDGAFDSNTATVTITVTPVNDPPVAIDDNYSTNEDTQLVVPAAGVLTNDVDPDGDIMTATKVGNTSHGTVSLNGDGSFTYTPVNNYFGIDTFTYWVTDGALNSNVATVTITVVSVNDPPVAMNDSYSTNEDEDLVVAATGVLANDTDIDGGPLTASLVGAAGHGTVSLSMDGSFTYNPHDNFFGTDTFTYRAFDGMAYSNVATVSITVIPINDPPVAVNDSYSVNEDVLLFTAPASVLDNDTDTENDPLTATLVSQASHGDVVLQSNGTFTYDPHDNFNGTDTFTYRANDNSLSSNVATVTITVNPVNDPPVAVDDTYSVTEDGSLSVVAAGVLLNDTDVEGNSLTAEMAGGPSHGWAMLNMDGSFYYDPDDDFHGIDTFTYRANDGSLDSNVATVTITVTPANDPPDAWMDWYDTDEDTTLVINAPGVLGNDSDIDGDSLTAIKVSDPGHGDVTLNADGSFTYTPDPNYNGSDFFTYVANDGLANSSVTTVYIYVNPVNDAPVAKNDEYSTDEDTTLNVSGPGVLANDTDADGDGLSAFLVSSTSHGDLTFNMNGSFTYEPDLNFNGIDTFTYQATDFYANSNIATVTITVNSVNDPPVAVTDSYTTDEDTDLVIAAAGVLSNDTDADNDPLTAIKVSDPSHGDVTLNANGSFTYEPDQDFFGVDKFTYKANDGTENSNVVTVTITVNPINDAPVAVDDNFSVNEDVTLNVSADGILANDIDVDGDDLTIHEIVSQPSHGALSWNANGSFTYVPHQNYNGSDTFTYKATDGSLLSNVATVTITINPINDAPVAANDSYTTDEDIDLVIAAAGVLANDSDVDGDNLTALKISDPAHGTVTLSADGGFTYSPDDNFYGSDTFTYRASDSVLVSNLATVTITVLPVNDAPVALNDSYTVDEDTTLNIAAAGVLANDRDVENSPLSSFKFSDPSHGDVTLNTDGSFTYIPDQDFFGTDTFTYRANDGSLYSNVATVTIVVNPINDAPIAVDDNYFVDEDNTLTVDAESGILINDIDVDDEDLWPTKLSDTSHGTLTFNTDGSFTYTPQANFHGIDKFTYLVNDGDLDSNVATVTITVHPINDAPVAVNDIYSTNEDQPLVTLAAAGVLANDIDIDGDTLSAIKITDPSHGSLTLNTDGSFTYTPHANFYGGDSFTYRANDGTVNSNVATVTITVHPVNDPPIAVNDSYSTNEDVDLVVPVLTGVRVNDSDIDGDPITTLLLSNAAHGTVTLASNGSFTYDPHSNYSGTDTFLYRAFDGAAYSAAATVTITVNPINDAPVAVEDAYSTNYNTPLSVPVADGVLDNDSDVDGDSITVSTVTVGPAHGSLSWNTNGSFTYTPTSGFSGTDTFRYKATDGTLLSNEATVTIVVAAPAAKFFVVDQSVTETFRYTAAGSLVDRWDPGHFNSRPRGVASNAAGDRVWIVDANKDVFVYDPVGNELGRWKADNNKNLKQPQDIATDGTHIWIVDNSKERVYFYRNAASRLDGEQPPDDSFKLDTQNKNATGIVTDGTTIWITDDFNDDDKVFVYDMSGTKLGSWRIDPSFSGTRHPEGLTINPSGGDELWIVDHHTDRVYYYPSGRTFRDGGHNATLAFQLHADNAHAYGIADPPSLTVSQPSTGQSVLAPSTFLIHGKASPNTAEVTGVTINGTPVSALDAAGNFFTAVQVSGGTQQFNITASDALGDTTSTNATLVGMDELPRGIDFSVVQPAVSVGITADYARTSFVEASKLLHVDAAIRNNGQFAVNGPILVGVTNISQPFVRLVNPDGVTPGGIPYFDVTDLVFNETLRPGDVSDDFTLSFFNPNRVQFTYDLVVFGVPNRAPKFITVPDVEVVAGEQYAYDSEAVDLDGDQLEYRLLAGPANLTINATTGALTWTTTLADVGNHGVLVQVDDGHGGKDLHNFVITVLSETIPNRPPLWVSTPVTEAYVNILYAYPGLAVDPDGDDVTYTVDDGPSGLEIDLDSGEVTWVPTHEQLGIHDVTLRATDEHGLFALQTYQILVMMQPGNHPPIITTDPSTYFEQPTAVGSATGQVTPTSINLFLDEGEVATEPVSVTLNPDGLKVDVFLLFDDTGSFEGTVPTLVQTFPEVIDALEESLPDADLAFGVGRFEEYGSFASENAAGRPFTLSQPIIRTVTEGFDAAIAAALNREAPGFGGDWPETTIEALFQTAIGTGFDGNIDQDTSDSGPAGLASTQTSPGSSGDVPAFDTFTEDPANNVLPPDGTLGGVGFRFGAIPLIIVATDAGTVYEPDFVDPIIGVGDVQVPLSEFQGFPDDPIIGDDTYRDTTPGGRGASIQETITALNNLGALVIGMGGNDDMPMLGLSPDGDPRMLLEALARLTGAINESESSIDSNIDAYTDPYSGQQKPADPIDPGDPFYFYIEPTGMAFPQPQGDMYDHSLLHDSHPIDLYVLNNDTAMNWTGQLRITEITTPPSHGTVAISSGKDFVTYTPNGDFVDDSFTYEVSIGNNSATATVNLSDYGGMGFINAQDDDVYLYHREPGNPVDIYALNNDYAFGGSYLRIVDVEQPSSGTVEISPDNDFITFTPSGAFVDDQFDYTIENKDGSQTTATIRLHDEAFSGYGYGFGDTPDAQWDDYYLFSVSDDHDLNLHVMNNDKDPNGDVLTITGVTQPSQGSVQISSTGDYLIYTPPASGFVNGSFTYTVNDGHNHQDTATVTLHTSDYGGNVPSGPTASNDSYSLYNVRNGHALNLHVLANDSEPNGDIVNITSVTQPSSGTVTIAPTNDFVTYTPPASGLVATSFTYTINDGHGSSTATVTLHTPPPEGGSALGGLADGVVAAVEAAATTIAYDIDLISTDPTVDFVNLTGVVPNVEPGETANFNAKFTGDGFGHTFELLFVREGSGLVFGSIPVLINAGYLYEYNAIDPDDDPITYTLTESPPGAVFNTVTQRIEWVPPGAGSYDFTLEASDGRGGIDVQEFTVVVTVGQPNEAPEITTLVSPNKGEPGRVYAFDVDAEDDDQDTLSYFLTNGPEGMDIDRSTGLVTWTPVITDLNPDLSAKLHEYTVRVIDGRGGFDEHEYSLTVYPSLPNTNPEITTTAPTAAVQGIRYSYDARATDAESDLLHWDLVVSPIGMTIDPETGTVYWDPVAGDVGTHDVILRVQDGQGGVDLEQWKLTVEEENLPPHITSTAPAGPAVTGHLFTYHVRAQDPNGHDIEYFIDSAGSNLGVMIDEDTGILTWVPQMSHEDQTHVFTIEAQDELGASAFQEVTLGVSAQASNMPPEILTTTLPSPAGVALPWRAQIEAFDPDGDSLTYYLDQAPFGMTIDATTGLLSWTPTSNDVATHTVVVSVEDSRGARVPSGDLSLVVQTAPSNTPPEFDTTSIPSPAANGLPYQVQIDAHDDDGDPIQYSVDAASFASGIRISNTGLLTWEPAGPVGTYSIVVTINDSRPGGQVQSPAFSLEVQAAPTNTPPTIITDSLPGPAVADVLYRVQLGANDADGDPLTWSVDATSASKGIAVDNQGMLTWTPDDEHEGSHTITFSVNDNRPGGLVSSDPLSLTVELGAVNASPEILSTPRTRIRVDQTWIYVIDAVDANGDPMTYSLLGTIPSGMTLTDNVVNWKPSAANLGFHSFTVRVDDGRGGYDVQPIRLEVVSLNENADPEIVSSPGLNATMNRPYSYNLEATDTDGDPVEFQLISAPDHMSLNPFLGTIRWTPTADQLGPQDVVVRAMDPYGGFDTQRFTIVVRALNLPPSIRSNAPGIAVEGEEYVYPVVAIDPEGGPLEYSVSATGGISVSVDESGVVRFNPQTGQAAGSPYTVTLVVTDDQGATDTRTWTLVVTTGSGGESDRPPVITSFAPYIASVGEQYSYQVTASDPDGDPITITLTSTPQFFGEAGEVAMSISAGNLVTWTPGPSHNIDPAVHFFTVKATAGSLSASNRYYVIVRPPNLEPTITSTPPGTVSAGQEYRYDVLVDNPDFDPISFQLIGAPSGMTIDEFGRVRWETLINNIGTYNFQIKASDNRGADETPQQVTLTVEADTEDPIAGIEYAPNPGRKDEEVTILVSAVDNVGVTGITLTVNGQPVSVNGQGLAYVTMTTIGTFPIVAVITDAAGNSTTVNEDLLIVSDDPSAPDLTITAPGDRDIVTAPTMVTGTISDPGGDLAWYKLEVLSLEGDVLRTIANVNGGGNPVPPVNGNIGQFDPTTLANGPYILQLSADDLDPTNGGAVSTSVVVNVDGKLKLGNFKLAFTDLQVPVTGIPITINRLYDTLRANELGEFGYGWELGLGSYEVEVDHSTTGFGFLTSYPAFKDGTRVTITREDGKTEGYTFQPYPEYQFFGLIEVWHPFFVPDNGVTSGLEVDDFELTKIFGDEYISWDAGGISYNPANPVFGGTYKHVALDGFEREIDGETGDMLTISDQRGNKLTYETDGIESNRGRSVDFIRDYRNRITKITDPRGNSYTYKYNPNGDLVAVTDRIGNATTDPSDHTMTFTYHTDPEHFVETVTDALGNTTVTTTYDASGRIGTIGDALQETISFDYDLANRNVTTTNQLGEESEVAFDLRGNMVSETNEVNAVTTRTFDAGDHVTSETNAVNKTTNFEYDATGNLKVVKDALNNETRFIFNDKGQLTSITDPLGNTTKIGYGFDKDVRPVYVTDPDDKTVHLGYDGHGNLDSVTAGADFNNFYWYDMMYGGYYEDHYDPGCDPVLYNGYGYGTGDPACHPTTDSNLIRSSLDYSDVGDVTTFTDGEGNDIDYSYDLNGNQLGSSKTVTTGGGPTEFISGVIFDEEDRIVSETNQDGHTATRERDALGRIIAIIDPLDNRTEYEYDARGQLIRSTSPEDTTIEREYDAAGRNTKVTDSLGIETIYVYDNVGRMVEAILPDDTPNDLNDNPRSTVEYDAANRIISSTCCTGQETQFEYDALGQRTVEREGDNGPTNQYTYDAAGRVTKIVDKLGRQTRQFHDGTGRIIKSIDPLGGVAEMTYDAIGRNITAKDRTGATTQFEYDRVGRTTAIINALGQRVEHTFDEHGNRISTLNIDGLTTHYEYNGVGLLTATILPSGASEEFVYDDAGRIESRTTFSGNTIQFEHDGLGRPTRHLYSDGSQELYEYNDAGRLLSQTDRIGRTITYTYNERGQVLSTTDELGHTSTNEYDDLGQLVSRTDHLNNETTFDYDTRGRLISETDALGGVTSYEYDDAGNRTSLTDSEDNTTVFVYDALNRLTYETNELGFSRTFVYNAEGNPTRVTDRNSRVTEFTYDALHRITQERWLDGTTLVNTINTNYNSLGRLVSESDAYSAYTYGYDAYGRLATVNNSATPGVPDVVLTQAYDAAGRRTSLSATVDGTADFTNTYQYDAFDRVSQVKQSGSVGGNSVSAKRVDFGYNAVGLMTSIDRYRDLAGTQSVAASDYAYDAGGRLTGLTHVKGATTLASYTWILDALNRVTSMTNGDGTTTYSYDAVSQLVGANHPTTPDESYGYDLNGNRTNAGHTTGTNNQLLSDGVYEYEYDHEGNRVSRTEIATNEVDEYSWDHRNRLTAVVTKNSGGTVIHRVEYTYDVNNRRIAKEVDPDGSGAAAAFEEHFVYDDDAIVLAFDEAGELRHRYLHGPAIDQVLADERFDANGNPDDVYWPLPDHQGTIRDIVDNAGVLINHILLNAFGNVISETNPQIDFRYAFTGRELDQETGLYFYRARYYDSATGRFLSEDPLGFDARDTNLSRYVFNNPLNLNDPSGMEATLTGQMSVSSSQGRMQANYLPAVGNGMIKGYEIVWVARTTFFFRVMSTIMLTGIAGAHLVGIGMLLFPPVPPIPPAPPLTNPRPQLSNTNVDLIRASAIELAKTHLETLAQQQPLKQGMSVETLKNGDVSPCDIFLNLPANQPLIVPRPVMHPTNNVPDYPMVNLSLVKFVNPTPTGTGTSGTSVNFVRRHGKIADDAGHVISRALGGVGNPTEFIGYGGPNLFPQDIGINRSAYRDFQSGPNGQGGLKAALAGGPICALFLPFYADPALPNRPNIMVIVTWGSYNSAVPFQNP